MSRDDRAYTVGDYWLCKRRDGKSPDIWQIATNRKGTVVYRSTKCRALDDAKAVLRAHDAAERSKGKQDVDEAELLPHLFNYIAEHGPDVHRLDTIKSSFRAWIGFLMQDELGTGCTVADINKVSVARFRRWRMAPHSWAVEWGGKMFRHASEGVSGEAVQRNIEDLRSALNHAEAAGRIPMRPRIPSIDKKLRSKARSHTFTITQLGAMIAYADHDKAVQAWLWLMIGTAARPDAALAFDPASQWHGNVIDLHPIGNPITDKRNPVVPAIAPLQAMLADWAGQGGIGSRKRWWRTMREKLGIPATHVPKTIRHTVASYLRNASVPGEQISALLGHKDQTDTLERTSERYAHVDPLKMRQAIRALTTLWQAADKEASLWRTDHLLTITGDNNKIIVDLKGPKL
jgi:hypothetical protein